MHIWLFIFIVAETFCWLSVRDCRYFFTVISACLIWFYNSYLYALQKHIFQSSHVSHTLLSYSLNARMLQNFWSNAPPNSFQQSRQYPLQLKPSDVESGLDLETPSSSSESLLTTRDFSFMNPEKRNPTPTLNTFSSFYTPSGKLHRFRRGLELLFNTILIL